VANKDFYVSQNFLGNWYQAMTICKNYGMQLLTLETDADTTQFLAIAEAAENIKLLTSSYAYIGATEAIQGDAKSFYWLPNGDPFILTGPWTASQPNNAGGIEFCLALLKDAAGKLKLDDVPCDKAGDRYRFYCQKRK